MDFLIPFRIIWGWIRERLRLLICITNFRAPPEWLMSTEFEEAKSRAEESGRIILAAFMASEWCGTCQDLKREVFDTIGFKCWAREKVVLLKVDFPRDPGPTELDRHNWFLKEDYDVEVYPTIIGLNADGTVRGRQVGYARGTGPTVWIRSFESATGYK